MLDIIDTNPTHTVFILLVQLLKKVHKLILENSADCKWWNTIISLVFVDICALHFFYWHLDLSDFLYWKKSVFFYLG